MRGFCITEAPYLSKPAIQVDQENILCLKFRITYLGATTQASLF
jgi:hypothetical protein